MMTEAENNIIKAIDQVALYLLKSSKTNTEKELVQKAINDLSIQLVMSIGRRTMKEGLKANG